MHGDQMSDQTNALTALGFQRFIVADNLCVTYAGLVLLITCDSMPYPESRN